MAINFPQGFNITTNEPVDGRLVMSKAEMREAKLARMPEKYFTLCKDDGKLYIFDAMNDVDEELGRFRLADKELSAKVDLALGEIQALNDSFSERVREEMSVALPSALKQALSTQSLKDSGLTVDEDGNIKVNLNEDHLKVIDNKIDLAFSVIQAIDGN